MTRVDPDSFVVMSPPACPRCGVQVIQVQGEATARPDLTAAWVCMEGHLFLEGRVTLTKPRNIASTARESDG